MKYNGIISCNVKANIMIAIQISETRECVLFTNLEK